MPRSGECIRLAPPVRRYAGLLPFLHLDRRNETKRFLPCRPIQAVTVARVIVPTVIGRQPVAGRRFGSLPQVQVETFFNQKQVPVPADRGGRNGDHGRGTVPRLPARTFHSHCDSFCG